MFLDGLEMQIVQNYTKWVFHGQMAGFVKRYQGLTFTSIRGAGHMAPTDKPGPVLKVIEELIGKSKLN
jgi:carboxypeptidase C (cathepsin A)